MLMKSLFPMVAASAIVLAAGAAHSTVMTYTTSSAYSSAAAGATNNGQSTVSDPVDWGTFYRDLVNNQSAVVNDKTIANGSQMTTNGNEIVTASNGSSTGFTVFTNGITTGSLASRWDGDFALNANILSTSATTITISFLTPVVGLGIDLETLTAGVEGMTVTAYNTAGGVIGTATNTGTSTGTAATNPSDAMFAGIVSTAGDISYVTIAATGPNTSNGFAVDTSLVYHYPINSGTAQTQTTPEPGTLALLGMGLVGLGFVRRRWAA